MKTITIEITDEAFAILEDYAPSHRRSEGWIISEALKLYRQKHHRGDKPAPLSASVDSGRMTVHQRAGDIYNSKIIQKTSAGWFNNSFNGKFMVALKAALHLPKFEAPNVEGITVGLVIGMGVASYLFAMTMI